ncbi:MAG TPA: bifunctional serine/threonine-protein kinase/universal stress protein [Casimicrobiaceae bacterium]|nr:bifunctional serine/threonine-protein kinase/universal stress protein [Casimicrobiaceae bacterium]
MATQIRTGDSVDGFVVEECLHAGGTAYLYRVRPPDGHAPGFPLLMKVPGVGPGEPTIGVESFEIEQTILPRLSGPHVPRVVAVGEDAMRPYLVMEEIAGEGLAAIVGRGAQAAANVARIGAALADAVHSVHRQHVIHLDLKPENFIVRPDGTAVLLDFGFARHEHYPDLLAEGDAFAAGSAAYVSPEQLQGNRADLRSDVFALGVILYELAIGEPPFGEPATFTGMKDRLWRIPTPPRSIVPDTPPWLQEIILHCLETRAERRYASAAHVAFDLRHPDQVQITPRGQRTAGPGFLRQLGRWWRSHGARPVGRTPPATQAPVILVAVDTEHPDDERHRALQRAARELIASNAEYRLMFVSAIGAAPLGEGERLEDTASGKHLEHRNRLRHWVAPLKLAQARTSLHVVESSDPAATILDLAHANHVDLIVIGAPAPDSRTFAWWRSVASTVTGGARCSVHVVRVPAREADSAGA